VICIEVEWRGEGVEVRAGGHAGYGPPGQDIVCAGVSAILYGCLAYLEGVLRVSPCQREGQRIDGPHLEKQEGEGWLAFGTEGFPCFVDRTAVEAAVAGLSLLAQAYPDHVMLRVFRTKESEKEGTTAPGGRCRCAEACRLYRQGAGRDGCGVAARVEEEGYGRGKGSHHGGVRR
jgi:uncharacterized protein YsxB (DUF464 family)